MVAPHCDALVPTPPAWECSVLPLRAARRQSGNRFASSSRREQGQYNRRANGGHGRPALRLFPRSSLVPWTLSVLRKPSHRFVLAALCTVGLALALAASGAFPISGDPELMYRPIKSELSRALAAGRLPFWSDRFGIGVPLVAESHVAAFYPANWLLYRLFDVRTAYRIAMWSHWVALFVITFAYARTLRLSKSGSAARCRELRIVWLPGCAHRP